MKMFFLRKIKLHAPNLLYRQINCLPLNTPELNLDYLTDPVNLHEISENVRRRAGDGDVDVLTDIANRVELASKVNEKKKLKKELIQEALKFPNRTFPGVLWMDEPKILETVGSKKQFTFPPRQFYDILSCKRLLQCNNLGKITGSRSYYLKGALAELEQALVHFTVDKLLKKNFILMTVPDLLHPSVIKGCGMEPEGKRTQVYSLNPSYGRLCLSGTAEMALAGSFAKQILPLDFLPRKVAAVSRCFRAEVSNIGEEKGIFRVHQFTKVEMFVVTTDENNQESDKMFLELVSIQKELFIDLGLHFQVLEMPPLELGPPAYRKVDIEAWMAGKNSFGEISSASNCTDYQSRRLGIKYRTKTGETRHCHTLNGTACAIPRMLIALAETNQEKDGSVKIPKELWRYMNDVKEIKVEEIPRMKWIRLKK